MRDTDSCACFLLRRGYVGRTAHWAGLMRGAAQPGDAADPRMNGSLSGRAPVGAGR